jgi:quercetin dioxygenase-like cupin family protein
MKLFRGDAAPRDIADAKTFVGRAHTQRLASDRAGTPVGIYRVDFDDGARTNWHTHSGAQWLLIIEGRVRVQKAGEPPHDVAAGDAVVVERGEKHWHGAAPGSRGTHLAVNVDVTTDWLEPVSDDQYNAR